MLHRETVSPSTLDLLISLCAHPALGEFALTGGTALALRFGHRKSIDLDFFTPAKFSSPDLAATLTESHGFVPKNVNDNGLSGSVDDVKVDFVTYRYALLQPFETLDGVRLFGLHDNIAMKLSAITNRGARKDFFDVHQLIKSFGLHELVRIYQAKYPSHDAAILLRSLLYFDDADSQFDPDSLNGTEWPDVKAAVSAAVREML
jgi:predicted nucleotidyltransferase component of viral defense system